MSSALRSSAPKLRDTQTYFADRLIVPENAKQQNLLDAPIRKAQSTSHEERTGPTSRPTWLERAVNFDQRGSIQ
jgi:hypothetical protein